MTETASFPFYIPTKGRPAKQLTAGRLINLGIRPRLVVQDEEHDEYERLNPDCDVIVFPTSYMDDYEKTPELDPHPTTGAAHNFAWDHSRDAGFSHHWIMDDNLRDFGLRVKGTRQRVRSQTPFAWHETFIQRWENLAGICLGQAQFMGHANPLVLNTRLYCATLYRNDLADYGIRWRRGLNDDTIVSLDILKTGYWCTAQSYMLAIWKIPTTRSGRLAGGMTDFYANGGFIRKAAELERLHPDVARTGIRFDRVHHWVDYSGFKQELIPVGASRRSS